MRRRLLVCGGRHYDNARVVRLAIISEALRHGWNPSDVVIVHGGAAGADTLAGQVGREHCGGEEVWPADWHAEGFAAGKMRNQRMASSKPNAALALPGGSGTADMVRRLRGVGIPVREVRG